MQMRNKLAAILTGVGLLGLAMSTFMTSATANVTGKSPAEISIAISAGPQLRLLATGQSLSDRNAARAHSLPAAHRRMICKKVYRLPVADLGIACAAETKSVALARN